MATTEPKQWHTVVYRNEHGGIGFRKKWRLTPGDAENEARRVLVALGEGLVLVSVEPAEDGRE